MIDIQNCINVVFMQGQNWDATWKGFNCPFKIYSFTLMFCFFFFSEELLMDSIHFSTYIFLSLVYMYPYNYKKLLINIILRFPKSIDSIVHTGFVLPPTEDSRNFPTDFRDSSTKLTKCYLQILWVFKSWKE